MHVCMSALTYIKYLALPLTPPNPAIFLIHVKSIIMTNYAYAVSLDSHFFVNAHGIIECIANV